MIKFTIQEFAIKQVQTQMTPEKEQDLSYEYKAITGEFEAWGDTPIVTQYLHHNDSSFYDLQKGNLNYSSTQAKFIENIAVGSQFRFKEDPLGTIYTMTDVDVFFKLNEFIKKSRIVA